jgi:hypothetical protein
MTPIQKAAREYQEAWERFCVELAKLPADNPARQQWELVDWQAAIEPMLIAKDLAG